MVQNDLSKHILPQIEEKMFNKDNIIAGIGSVVDLFGTRSSNRYRNSSDEREASSDYNALKSDWIAIGNDMSQAMKSFVSRYKDTIKDRVD